MKLRGTTMMPMASMGSMASMPQQLTHITTDSFFIKVWGVVEKDKADFVRDMIEVYAAKLADGFGQLRSLQELIPGKIILAFYNNQFHRAEVLQIDGTQTRKVIVFFVDLGVMTSVDVSEIRLADGVFGSVPRSGLAEDYILHGAVAKRQWNSQDIDTVNLLLRHCSEVSLTGVVGDKKIIQVILTVNSQSRVNLSSFLIDGGLADAIPEEQLTNLIRAKYGKSTTSSTNQNQFSVPPPSIPNLPIPSHFTIPQQTTIRSPSIPPGYANDSSQASVPNSHSYQRIRVPKPLQNVQPVSAVQSYIYPTLPIGSTHDVVVSHVIDGMNTFTVQLKKSTDVDLPKLMAKINDIRPVPFTEQIGPGALCLGRFVQDNSLCRAVVSSVLAEGASLYFVDFGNTEIVPFNEIFRIPAEFLQEPTMALRFSLADLSSNYSLTTSEAHAIFNNLVMQDFALKLKVVKPLVPTQQRCELFIVANGKTINIKNKILDKVKLMKPVEYKKITFKKNQVADVTVTFAESHLRFFIQLELNQALLDVIMKCVEDYCINSENKDILYTEDIVENMAVCAPYEDNKYYRGLIVDEPDTEGNITVFYVDYGNHETVHYSKLRIMNNEMMSQFPTQAVECRLDIDTSSLNNDQASSMFIEMADGQNFKMTVKNILPAHVLLVDLVDQNGLNLAEHLMQTFGIKSSSSAYAAPPKAPLQKSPSGNWREKNNSTMEGDFSSFRDERSRSDSNPNHFRPSHDDRVRGRNFEPKRRDSDGVDTTDDTTKKSDFWRREKGSIGDGETWRHDKFASDQANDRQGGPRDRNDSGRGSYRKRDDENDSWNMCNNQDDNRAGGGERRFDKGGQGGRSKDWENKPSEDEYGSGRPKRDGGFGSRREDGGFGGRREEGGFRGRREDGGNDSGGRPPRRDDGFSDRPPRRDNRTNDAGFSDRPPRRDNRPNDTGFNNDNAWDNKNSNNWDNKDSKTDNAWDNNEKTNGAAWGSSQDNQSNDRGGKRDFGSNRGGSFGDDSRGRKDGGFKRRDENFSSNPDSRGPRKWDNDFGSRNTVTLLDGFEKGAQIAEAKYQPGQQIDSVISWFVNPVNFYLIPNNNADFRNLMEQIQSEYPTRKTLNTNELSPNDYVVARDKDNVIYRATVLRTSPRGVVVTFVDYGNTETVGKTQVWAINPDHCVIPKQAILCSLQNIASNDENGVWKATSEYDNYFGKDSFKATLVENVQQDGSMIWMVNLVDPEGKDVGDQLVANNLALRKDVLASEELYDLNLLLYQTISVFAGAIESSKKFFIHIEPTKANDIATYIQKLSAKPESLTALPVENTVAGEFCLAPSSDESLYRALILSVNSEEKQAHILFIDYGDETDVSIDLLKKLPDYLKTYNAQAVQCCLYDSESFTNDEDFIQNINETDFIIKVMKVQDNVLHVKLFDVKGNALPYPMESDETVPVVCPAPVLRPFENVVVSSVTPDKAFLQRSVDLHAVNDLNNRLFEKYENDAEQEKVDVMEVGKFYVAKSGQFEAWYRCQLLEPESDKIFYIDYGNTELIEGLLALKPLDEEFYDVPACCFGVSTNADISAESVETLMTAIQEIVFKAVIKNTTPETSPDVELFAELCIVEGGVTKTFADFVVELCCGSKRPTESETIYNAFENWKPNESKNVVVSAVRSPIDFHLMLREEADKLTKLQDDLESALKTVLPLVGNTDALCAAKSIDDSRWYRCYQANNLAVDCGLVITPSEFKKLPAKFAANRDTFFVQCRLDVSSPTTDWHQDTIAYFKDLVQPGNELVAKLETVKDDKMIVDLTVNGISVAELLLDEGLVKYQVYEVTISHAVSLKEFYVQDPSNEDDLMDLLKKLEEGESTWETVVPEEGQIITAKFPEDEQWYRAQVVSVVEDEITVLFIDYGNQSICTEFRALPEELSLIPKYATRCSAHPLPENVDDLKDKFVNFVNEHAEDSFKVYFLSRHDDPVLVMLYFDQDVIDKYLVESFAPELQRPSLEFKTVSVVHVNSPSSFYVQTETPLLEEIDDRLGAIGNSNEPLVVGMTVGALYAAKFVDDGAWYRAKAISTNEVLFIDFGNTSIVEEVRNLPDDVKIIPFLAKHCAFKSPPGLDEWPQVATERFNELTCNGDAVFTMDVVEEGDPAFVQLIDNGLSVIDELYTLCKAELTAPSNGNNKPSVILSYVTDLNEFWIQDQTPALDELCDELCNVETFDPLEISAVEPNSIVAALFDEDGVWYRAKILQKSDEDCRVLFIDYGNESFVTEIKALPEDLASMPAFATRCRLSALPDDAATSWPSAVLDKLKEFENGGSFVVLNKEIKDEIAYVSLQSNTAIELGQQLVELRNQLVNPENAQQQTSDEMVPESTESQNKQSSNSTCIVTEAVSESEFHLQNDAAQVEYVQNTIQNNNESNEVVASQNIEPVVGEVVSALDEDHNTTYRSKIDSIDENKESCRVTRIDFGGNFVAKKWTCLPTDISDIAPLALKCCLSLPEKLRQEKLHLTEKFLEIVNSKDAIFTYKVVSSENDITSVELFKDGVSVLDLLLASEKNDVACESDVTDADATDGTILSVGKPEEQISTSDTVTVADDEKIDFDNYAVTDELLENDTTVQSTIASFPSSVEEIIVITEQSSEKDDVQSIVPSVSSNDEQLIENQLIDNVPTEEQENLNDDTVMNLQNNGIDHTGLSSITENVVVDEAVAESESSNHIGTCLEDDIAQPTPSPSLNDEKVIEDEAIAETGSITGVDTQSNGDFVQSAPNLSSCAEKVIDKEAIHETENSNDAEISLDKSDDSPAGNNADQSNTIEVAESNKSESEEATDEQITSCESHLEVIEGTFEPEVPENEDAKVTIFEETADADVVAHEMNSTSIEQITIEDDVPCDSKPSSSESAVSEVDDVRCEEEITVAETSNDAHSPKVGDSLSNSNVAKDVQVDEKLEGDTATADLDVSADSSLVKTGDQVVDKILTNESIVSEQEALSAELKIPGDVAIGNVSKTDCSSEIVKQEADDTETVREPLESSQPVESEDATVNEAGFEETSHTVESFENDVSAESPAASTSSTIDADNENGEVPVSADENEESTKPEENCPYAAETVDSSFESPSSRDGSKSESIYLSLEDDEGEKGSLDVSLGSCSTFVGEIESESLLLNDSVENKDEESKPKTEEIPAAVATAVSSPKKAKSRLLTVSPRKLVDGVDYSVTCVENPGNFYVQRVSDNKFVQTLEKHLKETYDKKHVVADAEIGSMYGARMGNSWFRVRVLDSDPYHGYHVCCLDYGNTVYIKDLFELPFELKALTPLATRCSLPLPAHLNKWPLDVTVLFEEITLLNNPIFKLQRVDPTIANEEVQIVNLTNEEFDVWKEMKEMCVKYEDEEVSKDS